MNFLPRDICEKLVEKGCKSESGLWYLSTLPGVHYIWLDEDKYHPICQAFIFQDFCGISEQSKINRQILWPNFDINGAGCEWEDKLFDMLKMTWDEWVEFMRKTLGL